MKTITLVLAATTLGAAFFSQTQGLSAHTKALQTAQSLEATFTVAKLPAAPVEGRVAYSRPNQFVIETAERLVVCDGKMLRELDKASNTYTESAAGVSPTSNDDVLAWAVFFAADGLKEPKSIAPGQKRSIKGNPVQEWSMQLPGGKSLTLYIDQKLGFAIGSSVKVGGVEYLTIATDIKTGGEPLDVSRFAWTPPAGAKLAEKPKPTEDVPFSKVDAILRENCFACHDGPGGKDGVNLSTYETIMAGQRGRALIVPGEPDKSALYRQVRSGAMPPMGPKLSSAQVKTIENWILGGAKK